MASGCLFIAFLLAIIAMHISRIEGKKFLLRIGGKNHTSSSSLRLLTSPLLYMKDIFDSQVARYGLPTAGTVVIAAAQVTHEKHGKWVHERWGPALVTNTNDKTVDVQFLPRAIEYFEKECSYDEGTFEKPISRKFEDYSVIPINREISEEQAANLYFAQCLHYNIPAADPFLRGFGVTGGMLAHYFAMGGPPKFMYPKDGGYDSEPLSALVELSSHATLASEQPTQPEYTSHLLYMKRLVDAQIGYYGSPTVGTVVIAAVEVTHEKHDKWTHERWGPGIVSSVGEGQVEVQFIPDFIEYLESTLNYPRGTFDKPVRRRFRDYSVMPIDLEISEQQAAVLYVAKAYHYNLPAADNFMSGYGVTGAMLAQYFAIGDPPKFMYPVDPNNVYGDGFRSVALVPQGYMPQSGEAPQGNFGVSAPARVSAQVSKMPVSPLLYMRRMFSIQYTNLGLPKVGSLVIAAAEVTNERHEKWAHERWGPGVATAADEHKVEVQFLPRFIKYLEDRFGYVKGLYDHPVPRQFNFFSVLLIDGEISKEQAEQLYFAKRSHYNIPAADCFCDGHGVTGGMLAQYVAMGDPPKFMYPVDANSPFSRGYKSVLVAPPKGGHQSNT